ncbi:hypothetical protein KCU91_g120, partial [Aureobasidium melanogenum]
MPIYPSYPQPILPQIIKLFSLEQHSNNPKPNSLDPISRRPNYILPLLLISNILPTPYIHLLNLNPPLPVPAPNLMSKPQHQKDGNSNVANQEIRNIPPRRDKDVKAISQGDQDHNNKREVGGIRLERSAEGDGGDVCEPVEHGSAAVADIQESETTDAEGEEYGYPRNTFFVATEEDFGGLVCGGEDSGVDDVVEAFDACILDGDDKR